MRRRARVVPFARKPPASRAKELSLSLPTKWPLHLQLAWKILHGELGIPIPASRKLIIDSASAASLCAQEINERTNLIEQRRLDIKVRNAFERLANCIRRAPASLRSSLDQRVRSILQCGVVDLEVIEEILDATADAFGGSSQNEAAKTALKAMLVRSSDGKQVNALKRDYSGLDFDSQRHCERALSAFADVPNETVVASSIYKALASALSTDRSSGPGAEISDLIVKYVSVVAALWRRVGLHPSRARHPADPKYKSKFHQFVEFVLTATVDPWSQRHDGNLDDIRLGVWKAHASLPKTVRRFVSRRPRRSDAEWLISEDHIRKALRARIQKFDRVTP